MSDNQYNPVACEHKLPNGFSAWQFQSEEQSNLGGQNKVSIHVCLLCGEISIGGYRPSKDETRTNSFHEVFHICHPDAIDAIIKQANYYNEGVKWGRVNPSESTEVPPMRPEDHEQVEINKAAGMPDYEASFKSGYTAGRDAGYKKGEREGGAVWVKATERLPAQGGIDNKVIVRGLLNEQGYANHHFVAYGFRNFSKVKQEMYFEYGSKSFLTNDVEWLDESGTAAGSGKEEAVKFVEWVRSYCPQIYNGWMHDGKQYTTAQLYDIYKQKNK